LAKAVNSLRQKYTDGINWVAPENYQITFFFLVEISTKQVAKKNINETLSGLSCQKK
jgi:2'-5' RNA ligase